MAQSLSARRQNFDLDCASLSLGRQLIKTDVRALNPISYQDPVATVQSALVKTMRDNAKTVLRCPAHCVGHSL